MCGKLKIELDTCYDTSENNYWNVGIIVTLSRDPLAHRMRTVAVLVRPLSNMTYV